MHNYKQKHEVRHKVWPKFVLNFGIITATLGQTLGQSLACSTGPCATTVHSAACSPLHTVFCSRVWLLLLLHPCGGTSGEAQAPRLLGHNLVAPLILACCLDLSGTQCNEGCWGVVAPVLAQIYCTARAGTLPCTVGRSAVSSLAGIPGVQRTAIWVHPCGMGVTGCVK